MKLNQAAEGLFNFTELGHQDSNKLDYITETIEDLEEDEKLIIWSRFKPITYLLYSKYREKAILLNGDVPAAQVELGIFAFNGLETGEELKRYEQLQNRQKGWNFRPGSAQLCFATSSEVGSLGLDLQRYCSRQIVSVQADLWATDEQTLSRISRIGQKEKVFSEFLLSNLTTEAARLERKLEKYKNNINILEGSTSITYNDLESMIEEIYKNARA
jgi:SNF2 family DNA or RNA helicase